MAGGKRKVFNRKTRSKRQNETENTDENPPAKSLRGSSCQGKKPKLEETANDNGKRPLSVQVDLTTEVEPTTSIHPKMKDDDASKKASKYVPPFSRTRNSGSKEEESGSKSIVTRSSTRKTNLLNVLAEVAKQNLEFEDRNDETSSLELSEKKAASSLELSEKKAETCLPNDNERKQDGTLETPPAKQPKLRERIRINRHFSLNLKGKGKKKAKLNESQMKEEKIDMNAGIEETLEEDEGQDTTADEIHNEKRHHQISEERSKDKIKENESEQEVNGKGESDSAEAKHIEKHYKPAEELLKEESSKLPSYHASDGSDGTEHSECGSDNEMRPRKETPSDSMIKDTKMLYKDTVIKACVDYLIQAAEEGISVDVVGIDNNLVQLDSSTKKKGHVDEGLPTQQREKDDHCNEVHGDHIHEESTDAVDNDQTSLEIQEAMMPRHSELENPHIKVVGDSDENSILIKLAGEADDKSQTDPDGDDKHCKEELNTRVQDVDKGDLSNIEVIGDNNHDDECYKKELDSNTRESNNTGHVGTVDDSKIKVQLLDTEMQDEGKKGHAEDIDVVGIDHENDKEGFSNETHDHSRMAHSNDIDGVGDGENNEEVLGSKMECQEDIIDVVGDTDGEISIKSLAEDEVHTGSKVQLSDDANVAGDDGINLKNLGGNEMHADSKADLSDDVDVVGYDDHHSVVGKSLQPELTANVGDIGNLEHPGRNPNDSNIPSDIDTTTNFEENHNTINPGDGENADHNGTKTSNETRKSSFKDNAAIDNFCYTAASQMNVLTGTLSIDGKITPMKGASLEELEVLEVESVKMLPDILVKDTDKGHGNQEKSEQEKCNKQDKSLIILEKGSSAVSKECSTSGTALLKCGGEMDLDYVIDCTDSQLIGAKPNNVSDGFRYDDFNLEDLMDCTDSQLVDIENQVSDQQQTLSANDGVSQELIIEDGTAAVQDLIKEISSIKLYLLDAWNRYEQVKKKRHLAYTPVIKKRM